MIGTFLSCVSQELNSFFHTRFDNLEKTVFFSPLMELDGSLAIPRKNILVLSLVQLNQDPMRAVPNIGSHHGNRVIQPLLQLELYVLLGAYFESKLVQEGTNMLTSAISFLHGKPIWDLQNTPKMPTSMEKVTFEMVSLDMMQQAHLWSSLGAKYFPSVVYKLRILLLEDQKVAEIPPIKQTD